MGHPTGVHCNAAFNMFAGQAWPGLSNNNVICQVHTFFGTITHKQPHWSNQPSPYIFNLPIRFSSFLTSMLWLHSVSGPHKSHHSSPLSHRDQSHPYSELLVFDSSVLLMCGQFQVQLLDPEEVVNVVVEEGKPISAPSVTEFRSMGFLVISEILRKHWGSGKIFLYRHHEYCLTNPPLWGGHIDFSTLYLF